MRSTSQLAWSTYYYKYFYAWLLTFQKVKSHFLIGEAPPGFVTLLTKMLVRTLRQLPEKTQYHALALYAVIRFKYNSILKGAFPLLFDIKLGVIFKK